MENGLRLRGSSSTRSGVIHGDIYNKPQETSNDRTPEHVTGCVICMCRARSRLTLGDLGVSVLNRRIAAAGALSGHKP